jgi:hypothetical protein
MRDAGEVNLGARPLFVLTAARDAQKGWMGLQSDLAKLSSQSTHRVIANATHSSLVEGEVDARSSSQAIREVVATVRDLESAIRRGSSEVTR